VEQAVAVGDLDREAGPRVELEDQRALVLVEHDIDADVAQARQFVGARRDQQQLVPARDLQAHDRVLGVGMFLHRLVAEHAAAGDAAGDVDADPDRALVQVGLAVGQARGQADHAHHRVAQEHDDADVRHALVADVVEDRVELHAVLDQHVVGLAAEAEQSREHVRQVVVELVAVEEAAVGAAVLVAAAPGDDEDAVAARAVRRLDHELLAMGDLLVQLGDLVLLAHHGVQLGHRQAGRERQVLGDELVVDARIELARVVHQYEIGVALADAHQPLLAQAPGDAGQAEHGAPTPPASAPALPARRRSAAARGRRPRAPGRGSGTAR